jgi:hypothetical protein
VPLVAAYEDGASIGQLAAHFNCSNSPVRDLLLDAGVVLRERRNRTHEEIAKGQSAVDRHARRPAST